MLKINLDWLPTLKNQKCPISLEKLEASWHRAGLSSWGKRVGTDRVPPSEGACVLWSPMAPPAASFIHYLPEARTYLICELPFEEQNGFLLPSTLSEEIVTWGRRHVGQFRNRLPGRPGLRECWRWGCEGGEGTCVTGMGRILLPHCRGQKGPRRGGRGEKEKRFAGSLGFKRAGSPEEKGTTSYGFSRVPQKDPWKS